MPRHLSQHTHSKSLKHTWLVLYVSICAMLVASRILHIKTSRFGSELAMPLDSSQVRLTGSTMFLTVIEYASVSIYAA